MILSPEAANPGVLSGLGGEVRRLEYPSLGAATSCVVEVESPETLTHQLRDLRIRTEEKEREFARRLEDERKAALEQGRREAGSEQAGWRADCSVRLERTLEGFRRDREQYFARLEQEVVRLALAIAERVLQRESQLDPLLLAGAVRVALGQLSASTEVRLLVPPDQKEMWAEMIRLMPNLPLRPEVQAEVGLQGAEAILQTSLGAADLGVQSQLREIERNLLGLPRAGLKSIPADAAAERGK